MIKAIVFDADHTLYKPRTERAYEVKFKYLAGRLGISARRLREIWEEQVERAINAGGPENRAREAVLEKTLMELELPLEDREDLVEEALDRFWRQVVEDLEYEREVDSVIERLRGRGIDIMAVASDEFREPLERKLNRVLGDWRSYFNLLVTPADTGEMKPSESFLTRILEEKGLEPSEVLVVGDSWERDLAPARELGVHTVLLADEREGDPEFHVRSLGELEEVVEKL